MDKNSFRRVKNLLREKIRGGYPVIIAGLDNRHVTARVNQFIGEDQIVLATSNKEVADTSTEESLTLYYGKAARLLVNEAAGKTEEVNELGQLKNMLDEVLSERLLTSEVKADRKGGNVNKPSPKPASSSSIDDLADGEQQLEPMQRFAQSFLAAEEKAGEEGVGSRTVSSLLKSAGVETNQRDLADAGWLESITRKGKTRAGGYRSTEKLRKKASEVIVGQEPDDPYKRLHFLISSKPRVESRVVQLRQELSEAEAQLERIKAAEVIDKKLRDFLGKEEA